MSERTRVHHTRRRKPLMYKVIVEFPDKIKTTSFIPEKALLKLEEFLETYSDEEKTYPWEELASSRLKKYKKSGLALRGARFREGLTQKDLAKRSGVSQENISKMENGKRGIGEKVARRLAKALDIDPSLLLS